MTRVHLPLLLLLAGCVAPAARPGFEEVRRGALERGLPEPAWAQDEDPTLRDEVRALLAGEVGPDQAVRVALLVSPRLQVLYEELSLSQADVVQASRPRNPSLELGLKLPVGGAGVGPELAFAHSLVDLIRLPLRQAMAESAFAATRLRVTAAVVDEAARVRAAFLTHQAALELVELRRSAAEAQALRWELARRQVEAGNASDWELALERAQWEERRLELAAAEAEVQVARPRLDALLGLSGPATAWRVAPGLPAPPASEPDLDAVEARAVAANLALQALRLDLRGAGGALQQARLAAFLPELELGGTAEGEPGGDWSAGPSLSLPLPLFDQGQAGVAVAEAHQRRLRAAERALAVELRGAARAARLRTLAARQRVEWMAAVLLPRWREVREQAQRQYDAMQIGAPELLRTRQAELEAGARQVAELRAYWLARVELERLLAGGSPTAGSNDAPAGARPTEDMSDEGGH